MAQRTPHTVNMRAVYVPASPYNTVPPQLLLLVKELKASGCGANSELDDKLFVLHLVPAKHRQNQLDVIRNPTYGIQQGHDRSS
jgi:hypothetical protein